MADETNIPQEQQEQQEQSVPENTPGNQNGAGNETPSFDDLLKNGHQAEFDRRVSKAIATAKANWEKAQAEEQDEATKLARMTAAERERYQLDKDRKAFAEEQAKFAAQQMQVSVGAELQKRGLDASFARYLAGKTAEESKTNIDEFEQLFRTAVQAGVNTAMRGKGAPREPEQNGQSQLERLRRAAGLKDGQTALVTNIGGTNAVTVKNVSGDTGTSVAAGKCAIVIASTTADGSKVYVLN